MEQHIKVLSIVFIIFGILSLIAAAAFFMIGAGTAATILSSSHGEPDARIGAAWAGGCLTFVAGLFAILAIPNIVTGWGLMKGKSWARILGIVLAILSLPHIPIGTAIGIYALVILLDDKAKVVLNG